MLCGPGLDWAGQAVWNSAGLHWSGLDLATLGSGHVQSHPAGLSPLDAGPMFGLPVVVWGSRTRMEGQGLRATSRSGLCPQHPLEEGRVPWSCRASADSGWPGGALSQSSSWPRAGPAWGGAQCSRPGGGFLHSSGTWRPSSGGPSSGAAPGHLGAECWRQPGLSRYLPGNKATIMIKLGSLAGGHCSLGGPRPPPGRRAGSRPPWPTARGLRDWGTGEGGGEKGLCWLSSCPDCASHPACCGHPSPQQAPRVRGHLSPAHLS